MYTDFNHFYCYNKKCKAHKSKIMPATSPLICNPTPPHLAKHTTANIDATVIVLRYSAHIKTCKKD